MAKKKIFSIKAIKEKKYQSLELDAKYASLMGEPAKKFIAIFMAKADRVSLYLPLSLPITLLETLAKHCTIRTKKAQIKRSRIE